MIEILPENFKAHWVDGLSLEQHHADYSGLGSTAIKTMVQMTPAHFNSWHILREVDNVESDEMRLGSICHTALLEPKKFRDNYVIEPIFEGPTKDGKMSTKSDAAKAKRKAWRESLPPTAIPVTEEQKRVVLGIVGNILNNDKARSYIAGGTPERTGYFRDPHTGIKCKVRPDITNIITTSTGEEKHALVDFKTARSAKQMDFYRQAGRLRYDIQLALYADGYEAITGIKIDRHIWIVAEKEPPFLCAVFSLSHEQVNRARADYQAALKKIRYGIETGKWPGYNQNIVELDIPWWALSNEDDSEF